MQLLEEGTTSRRRLVARAASETTLVVKVQELEATLDLEVVP